MRLPTIIMVARNPNPAQATRASTRISLQLKSTKAGSSEAKLTKITKSSANGITTAKVTKAKVTKPAPAKKTTTKPSTKTTKAAKSKTKAVILPEENEQEDKEEIAVKDVGEEIAVTTILESPPLSEGDTHPGITHLLTTNPALASVVSRHPCTLFSSSGLLEPVDPFHSLCSGIIAQQVSGAAAKSIKSRFISLFNETSTFPTPDEILKFDIPTLRTAGLSQRKAEYISGLAELFSSGELTNELLLSSTDEIITEKLLKVRGLGLWSIQMFLMFALKRTDVFATGDLGIQRGMAVLAGRDVNKLKYAAKDGKKAGKWKYMAEEEMLRLSEVYKPYRSILSWYLWRLADTDVEVMKKK